MGTFGGLPQVGASGFHPSMIVCERPRVPCPGLVVGDLRTKYQKLTQIAHVMAPGYDETKSNHFTRTFMWAKKKFSKHLFFLPGHFLGE